MITEADLLDATGEGAGAFSADAMDFVGSDGGRSILAFLDDRQFLPALRANPSVRVLLTTADVAMELDDFDGVTVVVEDPRWSFYSLHNHLARAVTQEPTVIAPDADIAPGVFIAPVGVTIEAGVILEPNVSILGPARIGAQTIVRAGAVIGSSGFEHKRTSRGILSVVHDGDVVLGERVEIGALSMIGRGFARRGTRLGDDTKIDSLVMVAHGSQLGARVFVAAGSVIAGSCTIGDDVWIGPGSTVIDQARIGAGARVGLGSVVLREVEAGARVLGNPARRIASP